MVALAVGLWFTGDLRMPATARWWQSRPTAQHATPSPATAQHATSSAGTAVSRPEDTSMPNLSQAPKTPPLEPSPAQLPQTVAPAAGKPAGSPQGEAERSIPDAAADHPIFPVQGIAPTQVSDTFHDARAGHEHEALDIPAAKGTPVVAAVEGNVAKLFTSKQGGITVYQFDDSQKFCYYYAHLDHYAQGLKEGTLLRKGQVLGFVGTTGNAPPNTPHLHFAVFRLGPEKSWWKGTPVDPLPLLRSE